MHTSHNGMSFSPGIAYVMVSSKSCKEHFVPALGNGAVARISYNCRKFVTTQQNQCKTDAVDIPLHESSRGRWFKNAANIFLNVSWKGQYDTATATLGAYRMLPGIRNPRCYKPYPSFVSHLSHLVMQNAYKCLPSSCVKTKEWKLGVCVGHFSRRSTGRNSANSSMPY